MIKIATCDDGAEDLKRMSFLLCEYLESHKIAAEVQSFHHPDALLLECGKTHFDLYLLDIVMPMLTGIDVGRELRCRRDNAQIIYLTTSDEFAVDAFSLKAAHYLLKPYTKDQFFDALDRAFSVIETKKSKQLSVKTEGGNLKLLEIDDIFFVESRDHIQQTKYAVKQGAPLQEFWKN